LTAGEPVTSRSPIAERSARYEVERAKVDGVTEAADPALTSLQAGSPDWAAIFSQHYPVMYAAAASVLEGQTTLGVVDQRPTCRCQRRHRG